MPHEPKRDGSAVRQNAGLCVRTLRQMLPANWRFAERAALELASQMAHLAWPDRAELLDQYFARQADAMLGPARVAALVDGRIEPDPRGRRQVVDERAAHFATWCRAIVTAILLVLDEEAEVNDPHQALTCLLAPSWRFARAAAAWVAIESMQPIAACLSRRPGFALVLLATSPSDSVERFMARDAFWLALEQR